MGQATSKSNTTTLKDLFWHNPAEVQTQVLEVYG